MQEGLIVIQNIPLFDLYQLGQAILITAAAASIYGAFMLFVGPTIVNRFAKNDTTYIFYIIYPMLKAYVAKITFIVSQIYALSPDFINTIPMHEVVNIIGYLTPLIKHHELIFYLLIDMVNFLEYIDSPLFESFNELFEQMREQGNFLLEFYRALEARANIDIGHSAISLQDYET